VTQAGRLCSFHATGCVHGLMRGLEAHTTEPSSHRALFKDAYLLSFALLGNVRLGEVGLGAFDGKSNMIDACDRL